MPPRLLLLLPPAEARRCSNRTAAVAAVDVVEGRLVWAGWSALAPVRTGRMLWRRRAVPRRWRGTHRPPGHTATSLPAADAYPSSVGSETISEQEPQRSASVFITNDRKHNTQIIYTRVVITNKQNICWNAKRLNITIRQAQLRNILSSRISKQKQRFGKSFANAKSKWDRHFTQDQRLAYTQSLTQTLQRGGCQWDTNLFLTCLGRSFYGQALLQCIKVSDTCWSGKLFPTACRTKIFKQTGVEDTLMVDSGSLSWAASSQRRGLDT